MTRLLTLTVAASPGQETSSKDESWSSLCFEGWQVDSYGNTMRSICVGCRDVRTSLQVWG